MVLLRFGFRFGTRTFAVSRLGYRDIPSLCFDFWFASSRCFFQVEVFELDHCFPRRSNRHKWDDLWEPTEIISDPFMTAVKA
jgi:hypothetical protein